MVFNKRDLSKAFSPKVKKFARKRLSGNVTPSTSGSTPVSLRSEKTSRDGIQVIVRVRPENEKEQQDNYRTVVKVVDSKMLIFDPKEQENPFFYQGVVQKGRDLLKKQNKELQFIFDKIFDASSTNQDVFEGTTKGIISNLLEGYNCSVFAYGATGAGKTHTMLGSAEDPGITYRTVAELFAQIEEQREHREFNLGVTYLEIYNENVQDLLHETGPLHLREDGRYGVIVAGLKIITIYNAEELLTLLARGNKNRTQHPTDANKESSRSHAVFQVHINITNKLDAQVNQVKLSMIDLAGSERASATGCTGARFKEGANINKSLLALGNCINNLADGVKHIPYRDSKLTRLLKDSLGGNCHTVMIANIAPSSLSYEDTYNTLRYANRAKKIKTHLKKNVVSCEMHVTAYIKMVEEQKKEISLLKQRLLAYESNSVQSLVPKETSNNDAECAEMTEKIVKLYQKKKGLNEKILSLESTDKILCCRMRYKKSADERLRYLTTAVSLPAEEQNASGKSRVNKSLTYFQRQRSSIRLQIESTWKELRNVEVQIEKLTSEIRTKDFSEKLRSVISLQVCEMKNSNIQQQFEHTRKICSLQQCELQSDYAIYKTMSSILQNYYNTMRGYGTMTEEMQQEFKQLIKSLEGVRNIKWFDQESLSDEEDFYGLTCLSIAEVMNPTNEQPPVYSFQTEDNEQALQTKSALDTSEEQEETIQDSVTTVNENDESEALNNTFSLKEKPKKRVLADKNQGSGTPTKLFRKSPKQKLARENAHIGKENAHKPTMSAKSIAILNKLKADRPKLVSKESKEENNAENNDPLKHRKKERRGLTGVHPYHKPNVKHKIIPALPSSRVPW